MQQIAQNFTQYRVQSNVAVSAVGNALQFVITSNLYRTDSIIEIQLTTTAGEDQANLQYVYRQDTCPVFGNAYVNTDGFTNCQYVDISIAQLEHNQKFNNQNGAITSIAGPQTAIQKWVRFGVTGANNAAQILRMRFKLIDFFPGLFDIGQQYFYVADTMSINLTVKSLQGVFGYQAAGSDIGSVVTIMPTNGTRPVTKVNAFIYLKIANDKSMIETVPKHVHFYQQFIYSGQANSNSVNPVQTQPANQICAKQSITLITQGNQTNAGLIDYFVQTIPLKLDIQRCGFPLIQSDVSDATTQQALSQFELSLGRDQTYQRLGGIWEDVFSNTNIQFNINLSCQGATMDIYIGYYQIINPMPTQ